jgi:hypothetical protein
MENTSMKLTLPTSLKTRVAACAKKLSVSSAVVIRLAVTEFLEKQQGSNASRPA